MKELTLYQFSLCPFCHKVRAGLELKGLKFASVEVNPMGKKELPDLPEDAPKKVPVLKYGDEVVYDSTDILLKLDEWFPEGKQLLPADEEERKAALAVEQWVDDDFVQALPTVIYGTWKEALLAAQVTARSSNFGFFQNLSVRAGGPLIMHQISKRILKKHGRDDGHKWVEDGLDRFEELLGDNPFVAGDTASIGDAAVHGAIACVQEFPIFEAIIRRKNVSDWFDRVSALRNL